MRRIFWGVLIFYGGLLLSSVVLDLLQGPLTEAWCWAEDRGWIGP